MAEPTAASATPVEPPPEFVLIFTRFPYPTETFLQREVRALRAQGARFRLVSLWGGATSFDGLAVEQFNRWRLFATVWLLPCESLRDRGRLLGEMWATLRRRRPPGWTNFWETLLGCGYGVVEARRTRREKPRHLHAVWGSSPAAAAWTLGRLAGATYSMAAHAYDLYEHGGDWLLREKAAEARFVRTSTAMAAAELAARGVEPRKILLVRRGLDALPPRKPLRADRAVLRLVCVARLVEKKGLERQLEFYAAAKAAGLQFEARIYGDGELRARLEELIRRHGLAGAVTLCGHRPLEEIFAALAWTDVLVHTGVVARSGDRDGLPNVIPEAMASGAIVVTSPTAGTTEAIADGVTGLVVPMDSADGWVAAWRKLADDDALGERLRAGARRWVEENFDAHRNTSVLLARLREET